MCQLAWYNFYIDIAVDGTIKVLINGDLVKVLSTTFGTRDNVTGFRLGGDGIGKGEYDNIRLAEEYLPFADLRFVTHQELSDPNDPKSDLKDVATALDSHWATTGVAATNTNEGPHKPAKHNFYWTAIGGDIQSRLQNMAITYSMTTDAAKAQPYFDKCRELMLAMSYWSCWTDPEQNEEGSLDLGYITQGMSYAYDLLYNKLSDDDRKVISKAIKEKGVDQLYKACTKVGEYACYDGKELPPNVMFVQNGGLGLAALAISKEYGDQINDALKVARHNIESAYENGIDRDGADAEGVMYADLAIAYSLPFEDADARVTGHDIIRSGYLTKIIDYPLYNQLPSGTGYSAISDNNYTLAYQYKRVYCYYTKYGLSEYSGWLLNKVGGLQWDGDLLVWCWNPGHIEPTAPTNDTKMLGKIFTDFGLTTFKSGWGPTDTMFNLKSTKHTGTMVNDQVNFI